MSLATIADLRHRVVLEAPIDTPDGVGGFSRSYMTLAQLWAKIETRGARADFIAEREEQQTSFRVIIRWRDDVEQTMRFDHRGRKLLIESVIDPDERRRLLVCDCRETST